MPQKMLAPKPSDLAELIEAARQGRIFVVQPPLDRALASTSPPPTTVIFRQLFGLPGGESRALAALVGQTFVSRREMHCAVSDDDDPESDIKVVSAVICQLRKKLRRHDIEVHTEWGQGFRITEEACDRIRGMLAAAGADVAATAPSTDNTRKVTA